MAKIVIADDHQVIIDGLKAILTSEADVEVVGEARDGEAVLAILARKGPERIVAVLDINMPGIDGIEVTHLIRKKFPEVPILILSMYNKPNFIKSLIEAGVSGYILKNAGRDELLKAIRTVHAGGEYFDAVVTSAVMGSFRKGLPPAVQLTKREIEILKMVAKAFTTAEIAEKLFISPYTVDTHRKNLLGKLNLKNAAGLVKYAIENGIAEDTPE